MRMVESGDGLRLAQEEAHYIVGRVVRIGTKLGSNDFDSYPPVDARILSKVNLAHSPATDQAKQAITSVLKFF
jgi:hypothetical protein